MAKKPFPLLKRLEVALGETSLGNQKNVVYHLLAEKVYEISNNKELHEYYNQLNHMSLSPIHNKLSKFDDSLVVIGKDLESYLKSNIHLPEPGRNDYLSKMKELREKEYQLLKEFVWENERR